MTVKHQSSLVLGGGGSRGVFTAGVLDYLMEKEVKFPYVWVFPLVPAMLLIMYPGSLEGPETA